MSDEQRIAYWLFSAVGAALVATVLCSCDQGANGNCRPRRLDPCETDEDCLYGLGCVAGLCQSRYDRCTQDTDCLVVRGEEEIRRCVEFPYTGDRFCDGIERAGYETCDWEGFPGECFSDLDPNPDHWECVYYRADGGFADFTFCVPRIHGDRDESPCPPPDEPSRGLGCSVSHVAGRMRAPARSVLYPRGSGAIGTQPHCDDLATPVNDTPLSFLNNQLK